MRVLRVGTGRSAGVRQRVLLAAGCSAGVALAAICGLGSVAVAQAAPRSVVAGPVASGSQRSDNLSGTSCVSASFCMAVGSYAGPHGGSRWLAQRWGGSHWRVLRSLGPGTAGEVSCPRAGFCMELGIPPAVWNGNSWRALKPKTPVPAFGLSCTSSAFCMAVGGSGGDELDSWKWNGHGWRKVTTPQDGCVPFCGLSGVSCVSASYCMAIGSSSDNSGNHEVGIGLVWNGTAWQSADPPTPGFASLAGVSCATAGSCVAYGGYESNGLWPCYSSNCMLVMALSGGTWQQVTTPAVAPSLAAISCKASATCIAVGAGQAWSLTGSTWQQLTITTPGVSANLAAVSCWQTSACMATGSYQTAAGAQLALAAIWNGSSWRVLRPPNR